MGPMPAKKPTRKVFHWEKDFNGQWEHIQVLLRLQVETLADYRKRQKKFDERTNEWDCCTEMGDLDASEMQAADWEDDDKPILPLEVRSTLPEFPRPSSDMLLELSAMGAPSKINISESPMSSSPGYAVQVMDFHHAPLNIPSELPASSGPGVAPQGMDCNYVPDEHSPADLLQLHFGFVALPPSVYLPVMPPTKQQVKDLALGIGFPDMDVLDKYISTPVGKYATNFFWSMSLDC